MSFTDLKGRIKAKGRPRSPQGYANLLDAFTHAEEKALINSQSLITEGLLAGNDFDFVIETAVRYVMSVLDYSSQEASDFIQLGKEIVDKLPSRPDVMARMSAYTDESGNPFISQTRH